MNRLHTRGRLHLHAKRLDTTGDCGVSSSPRTRGFTLIELMVALGLAAIISMSIMSISSQARVTYEETVNKVEVYNRFRYALRSLEEDLKGWVPTSELEFYQDGRGRGGSLNDHWDPGEEAPDRSDEWGKGVLDGGAIGDFDEFAFIQQGSYISNEPEKTSFDQADEYVHDAYRLYFQTITYVDKAMRLANVEYFLADPRRLDGDDDKIHDPPTRITDRLHARDLTLTKVVRYYNITPDIILKQATTPVERRVIDLATNVTDFRVEYTSEPRLLNIGGKASLRYYTPKEEYEDSPELAVRPVFDRRANSYRKHFGYGSMKLDAGFPKASAYSGARGDRNVGFNQGQHKSTMFGFQGDRSIQFAQLVPGDKMFVFTESNRAGRTPGSGGSVSQLARFPSGDYTVKANFGGLLEFNEIIDSTDWNNQNQTGILYKAAFLPAAVRITLRIVDDDGRNPKTLQRVVSIRRRSR